MRQAELLNKLCSTILAGAEIDRDEIARKEAFRVAIETLCRRVISVHECEHNGIANFDESSVQLQCFGSLSSGFATKASDMDLGLLSPMSCTQPDASGSPIPRLLEKAFLDAGWGARLLTRTRVPIIKLCEYPPAQLLDDLRKERERAELARHELVKSDWEEKLRTRWCGAECKDIMSGFEDRCNALRGSLEEAATAGGVGAFD